MSAEHTTARNRSLHSRFLQEQEISYSTFSMMKDMLLAEVLATRGKRLSVSSDEELYANLTKRELASKIYSAELFPDREEPKIIKAESEFITHDQLRESHPSSETRLSGEVVFTGFEDEMKFFMFDAFTRGGVRSQGKATINDVVEYLLGEGYIPVDALFEAIPISEEGKDTSLIL